MPLGLEQNKIQLVDHDPLWKKVATQTMRQLWNILGSVAKSMEHIGSTSMQDIKAKPIIDIVVGIEDFAEFMPLIPALERNGFTYHGWFLYKRDIVLNVYASTELEDKITTHHIHVIKVNSEDWHGHIDFRDYLNAHPAVAKAYEALKIELAAEYLYDEGWQKYGAGKSEFIKRIVQDAAAWRKEL